MAWTRSEYLSEARRAAEKEDDLDRYPDESLVRLFDVVFRSEWRRLLDLAPRHRVRTVGVALGADLTVSQAVLTGGTPGTAVHRILSVSMNNQLVSELPDSGPTLTAVVARPFPGWSWENEQLLLHGIASASQLIVRASVLPAPPATDTAPVDWSDEFGFVLVYELAGRMLAKGSVESGEAADQFRLADAERQKMMGVLRRIGLSPEAVRPNDDAADWGGA